MYFELMQVKNWKLKITDQLQGKYSTDWIQWNQM